VPVPRHPTAEAVHRLVEDDRLGICEELRERFKAFKRRDLYDIQLAALFLDAICLPVRPDGPKEGALVAWGFTEHGERVLLSVTLGMRESHEDWLELGCDLIARGLGAPLLVVADGAPGLTGAVEQCWPASGPPALLCPSRAQPAGQLPERERERVPQAYWQALDDATDERDANRDSKRSSTSSAVPTTPPRACPGWPLVHRRAVPDRRAKALLAITRLLAQLLALVPRRLRPLDRAGMTSALRRWRSVDISRPAAAPTGYR
jgi:putative transposase